MTPSQQSSSPPVDARVACVDGGASPTTNKACPEPTSKLDDHGRGGFLSEGSYAVDRQGRKRGPLMHGLHGIYADDDVGFDSFRFDGFWIDNESPQSRDLVGPWIDWKAECEKAHESLREFLAACAPGVEGGIVEMATQDGRIAFYQRINPVMRKAELLLASLKGEGAGA